MGPRNERDDWNRLAGRGVYPVKYASLLLNPLRNLVFPRSLLIRRMQLRPTDVVLEIGCGPGYFSPSIAKFLTDGKLVLFDYQEEMLDLAEKRLKERGLGNYARRQGDAKTLPFEDDSFDAALMVTVLGEIGGADVALREAARVLRPAGRLSITETFGDPDFVSREALKRQAQNSGLVFEKSFGPRFYYTCNFRKAAHASPATTRLSSTAC